MPATVYIYRHHTSSFAYINSDVVNRVDWKPIRRAYLPIFGRRTSRAANPEVRFSFVKRITNIKQELYVKYRLGILLCFGLSEQCY